MMHFANNSLSIELNSSSILIRRILHFHCFAFALASVSFSSLWLSLLLLCLCLCFRGRVCWFTGSLIAEAPAA